MYPGPSFIGKYSCERVGKSIIERRFVHGPHFALGLCSGVSKTFLAPLDILQFSHH